MSDITRVALDAMGGDNAPVEIVKGAVEAVQQRKDISDPADRTGECYKERTRKVYLSEGTDQDRQCDRGDRDSGAAGKGDQRKERFFDRGSDEAGEKRRG